MCVYVSGGTYTLNGWKRYRITSHVPQYAFKQLQHGRYQQRIWVRFANLHEEWLIQKPRQQFNGQGWRINLRHDDYATITAFTDSLADVPVETS